MSGEHCCVCSLLIGVTTAAAVAVAVVIVVAVAVVMLTTQWYQLLGQC